MATHRAVPISHVDHALDRLLCARDDDPLARLHRDLQSGLRDIHSLDHRLIHLLCEHRPPERPKVWREHCGCHDEGGGRGGGGGGRGEGAGGGSGGRGESTRRGGAGPRPES
eukprot:6019970-Prymnesium_polylepis.1